MAMTNRTIVAGVFNDPATAQNAIEALHQAGFSQDQIMHSDQTSHHGGGFLSGLKGMFTGEGTPKEEGNIINDLKGVGVPASAAAYYEHEYEAGHSVVVVKTDGHPQEAITVLRNYGAYDPVPGGTAGSMGIGQPATGAAVPGINARQMGNNPQSTTGAPRQTAYGSSARPNMSPNETNEQRKLRLREEQLHATKETVQTGEVGLRKEVVTEQQTLNVPVTHEEVVIERRAVPGGQVDTTPIGEGETIHVPVSEERVNVTKTPVVTGEVEIGKRAVEEKQQVSDTVKKERARIEQKGDASIHRSDSDRFHSNARNEERP